MEYFISQISLFGCNYAPEGWMPCTGQILPIMQNEPLFSLLGAQFGGDGQTTFALPNLPPPAGTVANVPGYMICVTGAYPPRP